MVVKKHEKRVIVTFAGNQPSCIACTHDTHTHAGCSMDNVLMKFSLQLLEHIASIKLSKEVSDWCHLLLSQSFLYHRVVARLIGTGLK